jgi:acetolactate synthase-1/2/3 large subunit
MATVAARYLALLAERGIDALYLNAGTDFAPLVEAYAENKEAGGPTLPEPVLCTHENLAVGMAHGAYLVTGRPQAVMFHVSVGTANAICNLTNAARDNVPLLVTAGRTPILEHGALGARDTHIHWAQEMFDQAGMLRELVKWDYELRTPRQLEAVVDRALGLATSHPKGPIYLSMPREVLAETAVETSSPPTAPPRGYEPDQASVAELADRLAAASFPVIVTSASGVDEASVAALGQLAEGHAIGLADDIPRYVNADPDHPLHLGADLARVFEVADALVFVDCDVPWIEARFAPPADTFVAQAGVDPLYARYPMRTHRSDLTIASTPSALVAALARELETRRGSIDLDRRAAIAERADGNRSALADLRTRLTAGDGPITKPFMSMVLGDLLDDDDVVFNEYWGDPALLGRRRPGTYFYLPPAGGLGWALPAALGAKHARPERTVVATIGDGAYLFANPASCHHAATKHGLPVLAVVANNAVWGAVDHATRSVYPDGRAVAQAESRLSDLSPSPALEAYSRASGGFGIKVSDRADLRPAIEEALNEVRTKGRQALVNVECA